MCEALLEHCRAPLLHPSRRPQERAPQDEVSNLQDEVLENLMVRSASSHVSNHEATEASP
jgi:hypothetical protein